MSTERPPLTVGVTTKDRPEALVRCLSSLALLGDRVTEVIIVDDSSDPPVGEDLLQRVPAAIRVKARVVHQQGSLGYIVARNTIVRLAANDAVLLLDDDAHLIDAEAVDRGLAAFGEAPRVAAVGFSQAEADGRPWPVGMQPSRVRHPSFVTSFIGFAHLLRRSTFLSLGGYRELFHFYGEEKDYCMRLLAAGYGVVYFPDALVAHVPASAGRSDSRYLRYTVRNDCLCALFNEPWPVALLTVPVRLKRYAAMRRQLGVTDACGMTWILGELWRALPLLARERTPMPWRALRQWHRLHRAPLAFPDARAVEAPV